MLATTFAQSLGNAMIFLAVCTGIITWRLRQLNKDGPVSKIAKFGISTLLNRWLK